MKKFLLPAGMVLITCVANAQTEYYASVKAGVGNTTVYVDGNTKLGDYLVQVSEENAGHGGFMYDASGLLWEISPALGIDWSPNKMYVTQSPYGWFHLRLEGELGYNNYRENGKLKYNYTVTDRTKIKFNQIFLLANGYADFRIDRVVPYVGLGLGYSFGREEITISNGIGEFNNSVNDNGMVYALHAGIGYKYSDIMTLDLGYRRLYAPTKDDGMYVFSTLRLGARFRI